MVTVPEILDMRVGADVLTGTAPGAGPVLSDPDARGGTAGPAVAVAASASPPAATPAYAPTDWRSYPPMD
ncbi:hypothetical protein, partial [Actinomadura sp. HBU206391]|uniref:hypothetical protein n=1 Tax=Actinomadura sp. HBU206391 TaxID=2731692 RepID=UPI001C9CA9FF